MELQFEKAKTVTPKGIFLTELYRALFRTNKMNMQVAKLYSLSHRLLNSSLVHYINLNVTEDFKLKFL